jgi:hypothetical protein
LDEPYGGRPAYYGEGKVGVGGSSKSRAGTDVTYWPKAIAKGARLETQCRVREVTITPEGLAGGVVYYDSEGNVREQDARVIVMACNGVGTPRLLLNSTSSLFPNGLANSSGLSGKKLMFHTITMVMEVFEREMDSYQGIIGSNIASHECCETDSNRGFVRGFSLPLLRGSPPLIEALANIGGHRVPWGEDH